MTSHVQSDVSPQGSVVSISSSTKSKSVMETILVEKIEKLPVGDPEERALVRTDSVDSAGSFTSSTSDVCRCDDCLLGIADLYAQETVEENKLKKKVRI